ANLYQMLDPVGLAALYAYSRDWFVRGRNTTSLPMIPLGRTGAAYLPGLRVDLSPFGIEYFQDNYLRRGGVVFDAYWTTGDNRYEKRLGAGFDVSGLPLAFGAT